MTLITADGHWTGIDLPLPLEAQDLSLGLSPKLLYKAPVEGFWFITQHYYDARRSHFANFQCTINYHRRILDRLGTALPTLCFGAITV